jgi:hypothetical protein
MVSGSFGLYSSPVTTSTTSGDYYVSGHAEDEIIVSVPVPHRPEKERAGNRSGASESYYAERRGACGKGPHQHPEGLGETMNLR